MDIVPYEFKVARPAPGCPTFKGYWVKLFCFFDGKSVHQFFHEFDCIDNACLARECGVDISTFVTSVLVTKDRFRDIFNDIESYVQKSDSY